MAKGVRNAAQEKQLGQHRINDTTATSLYSPGVAQRLLSSRLWSATRQPVQEYSEYSLIRMEQLTMKQQPYISMSPLQQTRQFKSIPFGR